VVLHESYTAINLSLSYYYFISFVLAIMKGLTIQYLCWW